MNLIVCAQTTYWHQSHCLQRNNTLALQKSMPIITTYATLMSFGNHVLAANEQAAKFPTYNPRVSQNTKYT